MRIEAKGEAHDACSRLNCEPERGKVRPEQTSGR